MYIFILYFKRKYDIISLLINYYTHKLYHNKKYNRRNKLNGVYLYYRSECWCGNQRPSSSVQVEEINCNSPCSGDSEQMCGGGWKIGIYSTGMTGF